MAGKALTGNVVTFGDFGLKAITRGWVSAREIEAARKKITYVTKRNGKYWIRIFPDKPVTTKPVGVKMGSGKGEVDRYVAVIRPGTMMFEIGGVTEEQAREALRKAAYKLSVRTTIVGK